MCVKSINTNQHEILQNIRDLHNDGEQFDCDLTYGNGSFYPDEKPKYFFDKKTGHCSTKTLFIDGILKSVVFDPPFLTYIKPDSDSIMAKRFSGYWSYSDLKIHYILTLAEVHRILEKKGILVFKCQDIIHNHKMHSTHTNIINWAEEIGFRFKDMFILIAKSRLPAPNRKGKQKHARIYHSYFLVLEKCQS